LFDCSVQRIYQLTRDGTLSKNTSNRYDKKTSITAYIRYLRNAVRQQGSGSSNANLKESRVELLKMQKKNAELAYQEKTGQLLNIDDVEALLIEGAAVFVGQKRSMGSRLSGKLAGMSDPKAILKLLNSENDAILKNTAAKFSSIKNLGKGRRNRGTAAAKKPVRVGSGKPSPSTG